MILLRWTFVLALQMFMEANEGKKPKGSTKMRKRKGSMATFAAIDVGVRVSVEGYEGEGEIMFIGKHHESGQNRMGVKMDNPVGKNNGTVKGHTYFTCEPSYGVLCAFSKATRAPTSGSVSAPTARPTASAGGTLGGGSDGGSGGSAVAAAGDARLSKQPSKKMKKKKSARASKKVKAAAASAPVTEVYEDGADIYSTMEHVVETPAPAPAPAPTVAPAPSTPPKEDVLGSKSSGDGSSGGSSNPSSSTIAIVQVYGGDADDGADTGDGDNYGSLGHVGALTEGVTTPTPAAKAVQQPTVVAAAPVSAAPPPRPTTKPPNADGGELYGVSEVVPHRAAAAKPAPAEDDGLHGASIESHAPPETKKSQRKSQRKSKKKKNKKQKKTKEGAGTEVEPGYVNDVAALIKAAKEERDATAAEAVSNNAPASGGSATEPGYVNDVAAVIKAAQAEAAANVAAAAFVQPDDEIYALGGSDNDDELYVNETPLPPQADNDAGDDIYASMSHETAGNSSTTAAAPVIPRKGSIVRRKVASDQAVTAQMDAARNKTKVWRISKYEKSVFRDIPIRKAPPTAIPQAECRSKAFNRTMDVLPNAETRVKLNPVGTDSPNGTSTYVNANYIRGANGNKAQYICAMGPLDNTRSAFWRMVLENKVVSIVMVTQCIEGAGGKVKCSRYWPEVPGKTETYGTVSVQANMPQTFDGYTTTVLRATGPDGNSHNVTHFWYHSWPDHGVPKDKDGKADTTTMLTIHKAVREHQNRRTRSKAPILVHCSAGVGRSGSFIAFDYAMDLAESTSQVNIYKVIDALREDRVSLVQHDIQCKFVLASLKAHASGHNIAIKQLKPEHEAAAAKAAQAASATPAAEEEETFDGFGRLVSPSNANTNNASVNSGGGGGGSEDQIYANDAPNAPNNNTVDDDELYVNEIPVPFVQAEEYSLFNSVAATKQKQGAAEAEAEEQFDGFAGLHQPNGDGGSDNIYGVGISANDGAGADARYEEPAQVGADYKYGNVLAQASQAEESLYVNTNSDTPPPRPASLASSSRTRSLRNSFASKTPQADVRSSSHNGAAEDDEEEVFEGFKGVSALTSTFMESSEGIYDTGTDSDARDEFAVSDSSRQAEMAKIGRGRRGSVSRMADTWSTGVAPVTTTKHGAAEIKRKEEEVAQRATSAADEIMLQKYLAAYTFKDPETVARVLEYLHLDSLDALASSFDSDAIVKELQERSAVKIDIREAKRAFKQKTVKEWQSKNAAMIAASKSTSSSGGGGGSRSGSSGTAPSGAAAATPLPLSKASAAVKASSRSEFIVRNAAKAGMLGLSFHKNPGVVIAKVDDGAATDLLFPGDRITSINFKSFDGKTAEQAEELVNEECERGGTIKFTLAPRLGNTRGIKSVVVDVPVETEALNIILAYGRVVVQSVAAGPVAGVLEVGDVLHSINKTRLEHTADPIAFIKSAVTKAESIIIQTDPPLRHCNDYLVLERLLKLGMDSTKSRAIAGELRFVGRASVEDLTKPVSPEVIRILEAAGMAKKELYKLRRSKSTLQWGFGEDIEIISAAVELEMAGGGAEEEAPEMVLMDEDGKINGKKVPAWKRAAMRLL